MNIIGFWDNSLNPPLDHLTVGDAHQFIRDDPPYKEEQKAKILNYLISSEPLSSFRGETINPLNLDEKISGGYSVYTDGEWAWTAEVIHLVSNYNFELPIGLLKRMEENNFVVRKFSREEITQIFNHYRSISYW